MREKDRWQEAVLFLREALNPHQLSSPLFQTTGQVVSADLTAHGDASHHELMTQRNDPNVRQVLWTEHERSEVTPGLDLHAVCEEVTRRVPSSE